MLGEYSMSTTLTNGLKLPDKGSVDWYADMQNNYAILDGAVGTVAEHTTALSGKAPLVHTHSKADITDLFNSANTWSALNSYSNGQIRIKSQSQEIGVTPSSSVIQYLEFADKNDAQHGIVGLWDYSNGASELQMYITDKFKNGAKDPTGTSETTILSFGFKADGSKFLTFSGQVDNSVIPKSHSTYDLGTSAYIWNNVYANTVYAANAVYTNTAWVQAVRAPGTSGTLILAAMETWEDGARIFMYGKDSASGSAIYADVDHNDGVHSKTGFRLDSRGFLPTGVSRHLGLADPDYKWATLNGVNPGALSLPDFNDPDPINTNTWDTQTPTNNSYTPSENGWLNVVATNSTSLQFSMYIKSGDFFVSSYLALGDIDTGAGTSGLFIPVIAGKTYFIVFKGGLSLNVKATFYPAKGNV